MLLPRLMTLFNSNALVRHIVLLLFLGLSLKSADTELLSYQIKAVIKNKFYYYRTQAIISHGLYNFYPIFHCGLYLKAAKITDNLCTKQGNSSKNPRFIIKSGFKSRAGYNGTCMVHVNQSVTQIANRKTQPQCAVHCHSDSNHPKLFNKVLLPKRIYNPITAMFTFQPNKGVRPKSVIYNLRKDLVDYLTVLLDGL